jgi:glutamate-1-semialdehyde 2,1-aminomutase
MGLEPLRPNFLNELRDLTTRTGVVLIFDEVVTGFRISKGGAQAHYGVTPDMTTMAKILGGGLPGGAVAGKADIINMIQARPGDAVYNDTRRVAHNGTFNANPLSAVAGIKALELLATTSVNDDTAAAGEKLKAGLTEVLAKLEIPGCATGINSLIFLRLNTTEEEADPDSNPDAARAMRAKDDPALQNNLNLAMLNNGIHAGNVHAGARFIMSAAHGDAEIERTLEAVSNSLTEVRAQGLI